MQLIDKGFLKKFKKIRVIEQTWIRVNTHFALLRALHNRGKQSMDSKFQNSQKGATLPETYYRELHQSVLEVKRELSKLVTTKEELIALRQENGRLRGKLDEVQEASTEFYGLIERTLNQPGIHEEYRKATEKLLSNFNKYLSAVFGVGTITPSPGDPFQDKKHQAVGYEPLSSTSVSVEFVQNCVNWGYTIKNWGDPTVLETIKPAGVTVTALTETHIDLFPKGLLEDQTPTPVDSQSKADENIEAEGSSNSMNEEGSNEINEVSIEPESPSLKSDLAQGESDSVSGTSMTKVGGQTETSPEESASALADDSSISKDASVEPNT